MDPKDCDVKGVDILIRLSTRLQADRIVIENIVAKDVDEIAKSQLERVSVLLGTLSDKVCYVVAHLLSIEQDGD